MGTLFLNRHCLHVLLLAGTLIATLEYVFDQTLSRLGGIFISAFEDYGVGSLKPVGSYPDL